MKKSMSPCQMNRRHPRTLLNSIIPVLLIILACLLYRFVLMPQRADPDDLTPSVKLINDTDFTCALDGIEHEVLLSLPQDTKGSPLILMLHGYGNSAESFRLETKFDADATARGYAVAFVTGAPDPDDPTSANGWNSGIGKSQVRDVAFLSALARYLQNKYDLKRERTFAVGFSNGAFMTHRLAVEAGDVFRSVVSVAGMMPETVWEEREIAKPVGIFQITGEKDDVVPKNADGSAKHAKAPAIEDVIAFYAGLDGISASGPEEIGKKGVLTRYGASDQADGPLGTAQPQVWDLVIRDGRHSWPDENITGININELILDYLDTQ